MDTNLVVERLMKIDRADFVSQAITQCPHTKVVMSGYSQGGQLVHNAAKLLPASTMKAVSSVVIFGDPGMTGPTILRIKSSMRSYR
jgi:poly(3-hydroxyalkanoate) synthetase